MKKKYIDKDIVKAHASGQWHSILSQLCPELEEALQRPGKHTWCPNPGHRGKHGDAFRLFRDYDSTGGGICNTCGTKADGFAMIMWLTGWSFKETVEVVARTIGLDQSSAYGQPARSIPEPVCVDTSMEDAKRAERFCRSLNKTWNQTLPLDHPDSEPVRLYLARRGFHTRNLPGTLRYHPSLAYYDVLQERITGNWPAMVALVQDIDGKPITLHRTYLTKDGHKANVGSCKKIMSYPNIDRDIRGASIRLGPAAPIMGVTEGIETGLSVMQATGISVWVSISNILMEAIDIPEVCHTAYAWADKDRPNAEGVAPGQHSATVFVQKQWEQGRKATYLLPELDLGRDKSVDWNDVLLNLGPRGFPDLSVYDEFKTQCVG